MHTKKHYEALPVDKNFDGNTRQVGLEFEFSGLTLSQTVDVILQTYNSKITASTQAEVEIAVEGLGDFVVEIDWLFLKEQAETFKEQGKDDEWLKYIGDLATTLVPIEIVCPPIDWHDIHLLEDMIDALRQAGAKGTEESLLAAYGLHINTEVPSMDAEDLHHYLCAFALLQDWLVQYHQVNFSRKVTPYINLFEHEYILWLCKNKPDNSTQLIKNYLKYNQTRNRALDMLPLFKFMDAERVTSAIEDERIKARPTFHYRLPNCNIDRKDWSAARAWYAWCVVEKLANHKTALNELSQTYLAQQDTLTSMNKNDWIKTVEQCLQSHELA